MLAGGVVHLLIVADEVGGIAGNGCQRGTQVVGNRAQQIGAQLFILGTDGSALFLLGIADILDRQCDRNDGNDQHNGKGDRVAALVCVQRQAGLCKAKIEKKHAGKRA